MATLSNAPATQTKDPGVIRCLFPGSRASSPQVPSRSGPSAYLGQLHVQVVDLLAHFGGTQQLAERFVEEAVQGPQAHMVFLLGFLRGALRQELQLGRLVHLH